MRQNRTGMAWREDYPPGCINLNDRVVRYRNLILAGMEGCLRYNHDEYSKQYTQFEMRTKLWRLWPRLFWNRLFRRRAIDIFVSHAPPFGIHDLPDRCHTGFRAYLPFMRRFRPRLLLHGHVHIYDMNAARETIYGKTRVVNGYGYRIVELD
jgi:Icc-related predicted phosphoesterase